MFFLISSTLAFLSVYFLPVKYVVASIIVLGQAHFLIAYIYTNKANKINRSYLINFFLLLVLFGSISFFVYTSGNRFFFDIFSSSVLMVFIFHYFNDEFRISGLFDTEIKKFGLYAVMFSFFMFFMVNVFDVLNNSIFIHFLALLAFLFGVVFSFIFLNNEEKSLKKYFFYLFFLLNLLIPVYLVFYKVDISIYYVAGFVIIFHYIRWYLRYLTMFSGEKLKEYIRFVLLCNLFFLLLFVWFVLDRFRMGVLFFFFSQTFFYGWTMIHIILSTRKEDLVF